MKITSSWLQSPFSSHLPNLWHPDKLQSPVLIRFNSSEYQPRLPGDHLSIRMPSYQYKHLNVKDKTVSPSVLSLTWESPYLGKSLYIETGPRLVGNSMAHKESRHFCFALFCFCYSIVLNPLRAKFF